MSEFQQSSSCEFQRTVRLFRKRLASTLVTLPPSKMKHLRVRASRAKHLTRFPPLPACSTAVFAHFCHSRVEPPMPMQLKCGLGMSCVLTQGRACQGGWSSGSCLFHSADGRRGGRLLPRMLLSGPFLSDRYARIGRNSEQGIFNHAIVSFGLRFDACLPNLPIRPQHLQSACPAEAMLRETTEVLAVLMQDQGLASAWARTTGRDATVAVVIWHFTCIPACLPGFSYSLPV